jgi:hypothetical protein
MIGDTGPYTNDEGQVWVPRTVPYLKARQIAKEAMEYGYRLVYEGKREGYLYGFTRDCHCEFACVLSYGDPEYNPEGLDDDTCLVPTWAFRLEER